MSTSRLRQLEAALNEATSIIQDPSFSERDQTVREFYHSYRNELLKELEYEREATNNQLV